MIAILVASQSPESYPSGGAIVLAMSGRADHRAPSRRIADETMTQLTELLDLPDESRRASSSSPSRGA